MFVHVCPLLLLFPQPKGSLMMLSQVEPLAISSCLRNLPIACVNPKKHTTVRRPKSRTNHFTRVPCTWCTKMLKRLFPNIEAASQIMASHHPNGPGPEPVDPGGAKSTRWCEDDCQSAWSGDVEDDPLEDCFPLAVVHFHDWREARNLRSNSYCMRVSTSVSFCPA